MWKGRGRKPEELRHFEAELKKWHAFKIEGLMRPGKDDPLAYILVQVEDKDGVVGEYDGKPTTLRSALDKATEDYKHKKGASNG